MAYAEVCVNSPVSPRQTFSYEVPAGLKVAPGQAVWVPFGARLLQGVIFELTELPAVAETRPIAGIVEPPLVLPAASLELARWISQYYLSPLFSSVAMMLPPGFERKPVNYLSALPDKASPDLAPAVQPALEYIRKHGKTDVRDLERELGKKKAGAAVSKLVNLGLVLRSYEPGPERIHPREELFIRLAVGAETARREAARLRDKRGFRQADALEFLATADGPVPWSKLRQLNYSRNAVQNLVEKALVSAGKSPVVRDPLFFYHKVPTTAPLLLTHDQQEALNRIAASLEKNKGSVFLLHGVTGSGKTEVYLRSLAEAVKRGRRGIVLVPEIALTPQTIERFAARFPGKVAVMHSDLTPGERFDEWRRIKSGEFDVVIGSRSALFAPQPDLGLIVIDEEQEWTYKQTDLAPRYHARDVALKMAELTGATVVLGSATPDIVSYYYAQRGDYHLLELPERVTPEKGTPLPEIELVDMRQELKAGNTSIFSHALSREVNNALSAGGQVILFVNRRGAASFVQCRACGLVLRCKRCDIPLAYHADRNLLLCHRCNYRRAIPHLCPRCASRRIKFVGIGTQKVEEASRGEFPGARLLRWDSDAVRQGRSHRDIMDQFRRHDADILIGTQMVAKGLDLPQVMLVGVVNADTSLNLPFFTAGERTFQLLCQVAGRAGRGILGGKVVIQTYSPEHYGIQAAARHAYRDFFRREMEYRRQLHEPPFTRLASLVYTASTEEKCRAEAEKIKRQLESEAVTNGADVDIIGPAPAFIHRLRGHYRWQITLRGSGLSAFLNGITWPRGWTVDIDPVGPA